MIDLTVDGWSFKVFNFIDEFMREYLAKLVDSKIKSRDVLTRLVLALPVDRLI